jgi:hypothetical protein
MNPLLIVIWTPKSPKGDLRFVIQMYENYHIWITYYIQ